MGEKKLNLNDDVVRPILDLIDVAIPVLGGIVLLLFLVAVVRYIYKAGDAQGKGAERSAIVWGLVALFVLVSIWGILRILSDVFFGGFNTTGGAPAGEPFDIRPESIRR